MMAINKTKFPIIFLLCAGLAILVFSSCASHVKRMEPPPKRYLTEDKLYEIHEDTRFTRFYYADSSRASGLMLRWEPDSILIQGRGEASPRSIPTSGIDRIETVTGNRIGEGLVLGAITAGAYFALVRGWELSGISFLSAIGKLFVPPAIIVTGIGIGASMEKKEIYYLPTGFVFDYNAVKRYHTGE